MKRFVAIIILCLQSFVVYPQQPNRAIDSLEKRIKNLNNQPEALKEYANLLLKYYTSGQTKKAMFIYNQSLMEAERLNALPATAALLHTRGTLFYYESQFDSALTYFKKALSIREKIKDDIGILKSTSNIGSIYYMMGDHKKALSFYEIALKKEAALKFEEGEYVSINNLGKVYSTLKMHREALIQYLKAEKKYLKANRKNELIYTYDGLSMVYKDLSNTDSALYYAYRSKEIAESLNELSPAAYACVDIALIYMDKKEYKKAKEFLKQALLLAKPMNDKRLELAVYGNFAALELRRGRADSAIKYVDNIAQLQKQLNLKIDRIELAEVFAKYYSEKKDFEKALHYFELFNNYKDSMYNLTITAQISEMKTRYETEKKEKENQLLQAENSTYRHTRNYLLIILTIALLAITGGTVAYRKIKSSNTLLEEQKKEIQHQKELVDEQQKEIMDSIHYARRIQFALLASDTLMQSYLPNHFVLFKPKAVVSGDFYWAAPVADGFIYVTADCTGHGVPGAFMSLLNISKLSQTINEKNITEPSAILNHVRSEIISALNPKGSTEESKDGMDAIVCKLNKDGTKLEYAAANNSFYIVRNGNLLTCKADKMPVGKGHNDYTSFSNNQFALQKNDVIYTLTDGFADQFGGQNGKKFKYRQLEELLLSIHTLDMQTQKQKLDDAFENWKGNLEQVDDICLIGVKIT